MSDDGHPPKNQGLKQLSEAMKNAGLLNPVFRDDVFGGATKALKEHSERWARIMEPFKLKPLIAPDVSARIAEWTKTQNALGNALSGVFKQVQTIDFKRIFSAFDWLIEEGRKAAMVEKSGWLPHHTTPFDLLESEGMEDDQIADLIAGYYAKEWAAVEQAFGVISRIDIQQTLKSKIDVDFRPYTILGACNPGLAHEALQLEDKVGLMLPCNVIVQQSRPGEVEVAAIAPVASMQAIDNPELTKAAQIVREKLARIVPRQHLWFRFEVVI